MDKVSLYRQHIQELLTERAQRRWEHPTFAISINTQTIVWLS